MHMQPYAHSGKKAIRYAYLRVNIALYRFLAVTALGLVLTACVVYPEGRYGYAGVDVAIAPPPPAVVEVPAPRVGFVWAPGYWGWNGHQHVWREGRWLHERSGQHWQADHWEQRGNRWHYSRGHWEESRHG
jgi:hypothetical protein